MRDVGDKIELCAGIMIIIIMIIITIIMIYDKPSFEMIWYAFSLNFDF